MDHSPSPPRATLALGPLALSPLHFVAPVIFAGLGALIAGASILAAVVGASSVMGTVVGFLFGAMLLAVAAHWVFVTLGRRRSWQVVITPSSIETEGSAPTARGEGEEVRLVRTRSGRGSYPVWAIDYGNAMYAVRLASWMSFAGPTELDGFAAAVRQALATMPRR